MTPKLETKSKQKQTKNHKQIKQAKTNNHRKQNKPKTSAKKRVWLIPVLVEDSLRVPWHYTLRPSLQLLLPVHVNLSQDMDLGGR